MYYMQTYVLSTTGNYCFTVKSHIVLEGNYFILEEKVFIIICNKYADLQNYSKGVSLS